MHARTSRLQLMRQSLGNTERPSQLGEYLSGDMSIDLKAVHTLAAPGLAIGSLYALLLVLAYRYLGSRGAAVLATLALATWSAVLFNDASGRFQTAALSLRFAMVVLVVALSLIPALAVGWARRQAPSSYARHAIYGVGGFFLAIVGSLVIGVPMLVVGSRFGW